MTDFKPEDDSGTCEQQALMKIVCERFEFEKIGSNQKNRTSQIPKEQKHTKYLNPIRCDPSNKLTDGVLNSLHSETENNRFTINIPRK